MRLFAAVLPPRSAVDELASAVDGLHLLPDASRLRWTWRDGWHFTLAFYGEVDDAEGAVLRDRLAGAAGRARPFPMRIGGSGRFGDRALWAGLGADSDEAALRRLAGECAAAGQAAGVAYEPVTTFQPHLTVAHARRGGPRNLRPYAAALDAFRGTVWTAGELALVRSRLPEDPGVPGVPGGGDMPRYEAVERWPLGGERPGASAAC